MYGGEKRGCLNAACAFTSVRWSMSPLQLHSVAVGGDQPTRLSACSRRSAHGEGERTRARLNKSASEQERSVCEGCLQNE